MEGLTGVTFAYNAISQDYCLTECVESLKEFCKEVIVLDAGSIDGTNELIKSFQDKKTRVILCSHEEWLAQTGKEKLSYFTNKAIDQANTDWIYYQQADEITHEKSYPYIRKAIEYGSEGYLITRINLWNTPYEELNVPLGRMPCSPEVIRLTKRQYRAYDDAENIGCLASGQFLKDIRMYHMGFVRDRRKHVEKIRHMQSEVFQCGVDDKLIGMEVFDPFKWFSPLDLKPISEPLPGIIQKWAEARR